jgi:hypothetical protein
VLLVVRNNSVSGVRAEIANSMRVATQQITIDKVPRTLPNAPGVVMQLTDLAGTHVWASTTDIDDRGVLGVAVGPVTNPIFAWRHPSSDDARDGEINFGTVQYVSHHQGVPATSSRGRSETKWPRRHAFWP